jgi:hypothetical protein
VDVSKHLHRHIWHSWSEENIPVLPLSQYRKRKMLRIKYTDKEKALDILNKNDVFYYKGHLAWLTGCETEEETRETVSGLMESGCFTGPARVLRIYEPIIMDGEQ